MKLRNLIPSALFALFALTPLAASASSAALYVSPASGTVTAGSIIPVQMRVNTGGDPVNAIQGNLTYNASQLAYQSFDVAGSAFSLTANVQTPTGYVKLARAVGGGEPAVKGDLLFATVYFKALTTAGTASVAVASDSHVVRSTDSVDIIAGAPAATGTKAAATGAPKPTAYPSIDKAKAAVAAAATPLPAGTVRNSGDTGVVATVAPNAATPQARSTKVLAWNSPVALGGFAVLAMLLAAIIYAYVQRRNLSASAHPAAPAANFTGAPHGSVDSKGIINSETILPNDPTSGPGSDSDQ